MATSYNQRPVSQPPTSSSSHIPPLIPRRRRPEPSNPLPVPETPSLPPPPNLQNHTFIIPRRRILSEDELQIFLASPTYSLIIAFIFSISDACTGTKISALDPATQPPLIRSILAILDDISALIDAHPPVDQGLSRFGNGAFRTFLDALVVRAPTYHTNLGLSSSSSASASSATTEVQTYLLHAFGSRARLDYGSGHELHFFAWLLCLERLALLAPSPAVLAAIGLLIIPRYVRLLRQTQAAYYLEPAGSHGVWGLDDYHVLPFLLGAAQLRGHAYLTPRGVRSTLLLDEGAADFLYLDMVRATAAAKAGAGLRWTQPMLDDIAGAKSWEKVEQGMRRLFIKEVLGKLPVMQHFLFGSLIPAPEGVGGEEEAEAEAETVAETEARNGDGDGDGADKKSFTHAGHVHREDRWGDCCGIKIPSMVVAAQEDQKTERGGRLRRIPFD